MHIPAVKLQVAGPLQVDLLAGRLQNAKRMSIAGEVLINDKPVNHAAFRKASAYVQQEDHLPPTETVRECLMFSAQLRLPGSLSTEQQRQRVDSIIDELVRACGSCCRSGECIMARWQRVDSMIDALRAPMATVVS